MRLELIQCYICGTTHGFGSRCPDPRARADTVDRLQRENARLRAVIRTVLPYLRGAVPPTAAVLADVEDIVRDWKE